MHEQVGWMFGSIGGKKYPLPAHKIFNALLIIKVLRADIFTHTSNPFPHAHYNYSNDSIYLSVHRILYQVEAGVHEVFTLYPIIQSNHF
jgi:hypothetical protein